MGQVLQRLQDGGALSEGELAASCTKFPDLEALPREISLLVLSYLNATDLCLAACVWQRLGNDEVLWQRFVFIKLIY